MKVLLVVLFLMFVAKSCDEAKDDGCENAVMAQFKDLSGLDGCQWVLELSNGVRLEPINLDQFSLDLRDGKQVWLTFREVPEMASICMVGEMVEILCISEGPTN